MILVLLPAFNEEESIKTLFPKLIKELKNTEQNVKYLCVMMGVEIILF